jgi:hypothetical protein
VSSVSRVDHCPSCEGPLQVRELYCPNCEIQLRGNFAAGGGGPFSKLNDDQLAFLRLFVTSRGNLSDIERTLGVSYPTVRAKVDDLIAAVIASEPGPAPTPASRPSEDSVQDEPLTRREILARVADGRMSPQEGMDLMQQVAASDTTAE